jgi:hypothetical protein
MCCFIFVVSKTVSDYVFKLALNLVSSLLISAGIVDMTHHACVQHGFFYLPHLLGEIGQEDHRNFFNPLPGG